MESLSFSSLEYNGMVQALKLGLFVGNFFQVEIDALR